MADLYKPPTMEERKSKGLRGEGKGDHIKFIYLGIERRQVIGFRKARRQDVS